MKKFIKNLTMFAGHLAIMMTHINCMKMSGADWFQFLSFFIVHSLWQDFCRKELKSSIYGWKY